IGTAIAALAALPCAPLLIKDLGDPRRFHHMLRVFKPRSPMNLGSWTLTAYSGVLALAAWREWTRGRRADAPTDGVKIADEFVDGVSDVAGIPLALLLAGYTGVLLSSTATPVWSKNPWLGPLFSASAIGTGAAAIQLALEVADDSSTETPAKEALAKIDTAARCTEAVALGGYLSSAGRLAEPLTRGKMAPHLWGGAVGAGLVAPELLERLPVRGKAWRWIKIAASALGLIGGFALRWAVLFAGHHSASDPEAAREASRALDRKSGE
ncbi:MAG: polysulfide reductase NrfD, partial [Armatimonadota bacterium]|nr:polysulfide reductase NrfD [Armatimonadota bacterium]